MKRLLLIGLTVVSLLLPGSLRAQDRTVSGKVTSPDDGSAIPGVNVVLKGTTNGAVTDVDGNYNISVPSTGGTLVFTFIGLKSEEVEIGSRTVVDLQMSADVTQLSEVVVTALGIEKQSRELGYAVSGVKSEDLVVARESNILNALQGKVTGVTITQSSGNLGGSTKIIVRGITSLSGRNSPLWVVDGVPINDAQDNTSAQNNRISGNRDFANGASVINPDDVASINVLKGAAASALYGSRAASGVILVTTKRGKAGKSGKPSVSLNSSIRFDNLFKIPDYQNEYGGGNNFKYDSSAVTSNWGPRIVGQEVTESLTGKKVPLTAYPENYKDFYRQGRTMINNMSVSDANERGDYRLSVSSLNQTGILPNAALDRVTVGFNAGMKHTKKLKTRFGLQYINTESQGTGVAGANDPNVFGLANFVRSTDYKNYKPWIENGVQKNTAGNTDNNPFWIQHENKNERKDQRFLGNFEATYSPLTALNFTARLGYDYDRDDRLITNRVGTRSRATGDFLMEGINRTQFNIDIIGTFFKDITQDLNLKLLGGFNYNKRLFKSTTIFAQSLSVPELFNPSNATTVSSTLGFTEQALLGAYSEASFGYKDWATLTLTGRNDWSSTLPEDNRSYFYPSASLAVVLTDALGLKGNVLNYAKLRASAAQVGNDTGPYQLLFQYFPVAQANGQYGLNINFPFAGRLGFASTTIIPPTNLQPEKQTTVEVGAELQFLSGRFTLDAAYFSSNNSNQILAVTTPPSTGFAARRINAGEIITSGFEISLDARVLETNNFTWNSIVNFTHTDSKVESLAPGLERLLISSEFNNIQVVAIPGKEYQLFGNSYLRNEESGRLLINPTNGLPQAGPLKAFGSVLPDFTMGFINNFTFRGFTLASTLDWRDGGLLSSATVLGLWGNGTVQETATNREGTYIITSGVLANPDGTFRDNDIPVRSTQTFWGGINPGGSPESHIFEASFVKLREVGLSYSFPAGFLGKSFITGLQIGVEGRNLALLYSKVPHIDPEATLFGAGADGLGVERNAVPSTRSIGFNVRITL